MCSIPSSYYHATLAWHQVQLQRTVYSEHNHIISICVCVSETGGLRKRFDLEPSYAVSLTKVHGPKRSVLYSIVVCYNKFNTYLQLNPK